LDSKKSEDGLVAERRVLDVLVFVLVLVLVLVRLLLERASVVLAVERSADVLVHRDEHTQRHADRRCERDPIRAVAHID
jgi:hypothetical protein